MNRDNARLGLTTWSQDLLRGIAPVGSDPKDRHVPVAAIVGGCQVIVTFNTKDFPPESVAGFGTGSGQSTSESAHP
jgi:hypothetical protein